MRWAGNRIVQGGVPAAKTEQTPQELAALLESFMVEYPAAVVLEDGKALFDFHIAKYSISTEHGRCTLHLWSEERNLVRRVTHVEVRNKALRVSTARFGQLRSQTLEFATQKDRRTSSTRETIRIRFVKIIERVLERQFPEWKSEAFRTTMDLEKSFGPAYARGLLVQGQKAWAVIGINDEEMPATIDGILTFGVLWLEACRQAPGQRRIVQGLKLVLPQGTGTLTLSRMAWLNGDQSQWELWELDQSTEELQLRDAKDQGNLATHLVHAPNEIAARERFAASVIRVLALLPDAMKTVVEQRLRSGSELAFLLHGLEFARVRFGASSAAFNRVEQISFGAGANETELTVSNEELLREFVLQLYQRRRATGDKRDPLYRMQPERWLESEVRRDVTLIDARLKRSHVYTQVPAFAASDRGMLDLLSISEDGRMAVIELKADEDPQLALQGLDYWVRVRWHHRQNLDQATGLSEFQRHGYFGGVPLSDLAPRLLLVAPALRVHPATEIVLRYFSLQVEWTLIALDERWRKQIKVIWRKRSTDIRA